MFLHGAVVRTFSFSALISCSQGYTPHFSLVCPSHSLSTAWCKSSSCVDVNLGDLRTWEPLRFRLTLPMGPHALVPCGSEVTQVGDIWEASAPLGPSPSSPCPCPAPGSLLRAAVCCSWCSHGRLGPEHTQASGSAPGWLGQAAGKEARGVSGSGVGRGLPPIHSRLSGGGMWSGEATCDLWKTTRREPYGKSHQECAASGP